MYLVCKIFPKEKTVKTLLVFLMISTSMTHAAPGDKRLIPFSTSEKMFEGVKYDGYFKEDPYFVIEKVQVTEVENDEGPFLPESDYSSEKNLGSIIVSLDKLIALGTKVYDIVKAGRPVLDLSFAKPISILPNEELPNNAFNFMTDWQGPKGKTYKVEYVNLLGATVISFNYTVYFQYGGKFDGKGAYLTGLTVKASRVSVGWGFEFNAVSELETITNLGSKEDPVAGATMRISYKASSLFSEIQSSESFFVNGKGELSNF